MITLADGGVLDVAAWPLPEGVDDGILNRSQLAIAFRVSENTVTGWVKAGMPVQAEGQNGVAYEFRLSHCWAWRASRNAAAQEERRRGDALAQQAAMRFLNLDGDEAETRGTLTAKQMQDWADAEYKRNRLDEQRGDLVQAQAMRALLEALLGAVRLWVQTLPDWCEREFGMQSDEVVKLEARGNQILEEMQESIRRDLLAPAKVVAFPGDGEAQARLI